MTLAPYVQMLGRGPGRSRSLTQAEAVDAMRIVLAGEAAPEAVGAMLMLLRMKGETGAELAGFVQAARESLTWEGVAADLDWPSYAAGRTRGVPWLLLSARLVARAGYKVALHGWTSQQGTVADVRAGCAALGIAVTGTAGETAEALARDGLAYVRLEALSAPLFDLLRLREVLGLRSCVNTVLRMLDPFGAGACVQGVFHPSYRAVQAEACGLLGTRNLSVIKGGGGEFERHPAKEVQAYGLREGQPWSGGFAPLQDDVRRLAGAGDETADLAALWAGTLEDDFARDVVVGTAALALHTLGAAEPDRLAASLWSARHRAHAA